MNNVSDRLSGMGQSDIRQMTRECLTVSGINLGQGLCDLPTPQIIEEAAIRAIRDRKSQYSVPEGILELRQAIAKKLLTENQIKADPEKEIVVTVGSAGGFVSTLMGLLNPGDGILLFEPYYGYHVNGARLAGLRPQFCALDSENDFALNENALRKSLTKDTKAIVICTPANPSGKMWNQAELEVIAKVANENDLLVITDEIYEYYRYDDRPHLSPAAISNLENRTVTLMGLSKTFSITGWRLGYAVAKGQLAHSLMLANDLYYICAPTPLQHGVAAGFTIPKSTYDQMRKDFAVKREKICTTLQKVGLTPKWPQGAYYVLSDASKLADDSKEAAMLLLKKTGVGSIPGRAFFNPKSPDREKYLRFCFAVEDSKLDEACKRLAGL